MSGNSKTKRPSRLGRGLNDLMAGPVRVASTHTEAAKPAPDVEASSGDGPSGGLRWISATQIEPNPQQPRQQFDESSLASLAESIKLDGVMQPIVVRPNGEKFTIVAGERRWRAAQRAGLDLLPALTRDVDDRQMAELALIENLQREDLNPIDRAQAFASLAETYNLSHDQIAERVGLDRSTVTNVMRLLKLSTPVQAMVSRGTLSMGHARAIAGLAVTEDQQAIAEQALREEWSVRQTEAAVKSANAGAAAEPKPKQSRPRPGYLDDLERQIGEQLGTKVQLKTARKKGAGQLTIAFYSIDQFDELLAKLGVETG